MANLRAVQKQQTRERLLSTALGLFNEKGYAATTIDDIAVAAGTTRVTFYAHFESRRELMLELIHELNERLERTEPAGERSTAGALVEVVRDGSAERIGPWLRRQSERWPVIKPYILAATEASASDAEVRTLFHGWVNEVVADIAEGLDLADRYPKPTRRYRGELAFAQLDQTALHWMRAPEEVDVDLAVEVLTEAWVKLLGDGR